jgi:hypothetical protein
MDFHVTVDDSLAPSFLELMKNLRRVKIERIPAKKGNGKTAKRSSDDVTILHNLQHALDEVKLAREGKITLKSAEEFLREL